MTVTTGAPTRDLGFYIDQGVFQQGRDHKTCPACGKNYFCLKKDGSLAKCFHPSCGFSAIAGFAKRSGVYRDFYELMEWFYWETHKALLDQKLETWETPYAFLISRHIHPRVIEDSDLGTLPKDPSGLFSQVEDKFREILSKAEGELAEVKADLSTTSVKERKKELEKKAEALNKGIEFIQGAKKKFFEIFTRAGGWLFFFYRDHRHNIKSIRLRLPNTKKFQYYKPMASGGFFGLSLFSSQDCVFGDKPLLNEGEINTMQVQSLLIRNGEPYAFCGSWGGVENLNSKEIIEAGWKPVICYDNDFDNAGKGILERLQQEMTFEAFTTPTKPGMGSDLDSYICGFFLDGKGWDDEDRLKAALVGIQKLIAGRKTYLWEPKNSDFARDGSGKINPIRLARYFIERYHPFTVAEQVYLYQDGFFSPRADIIPPQIQSLVGEEIRNNLVAEVMGAVGRNLVFRPDDLNPEAETWVNLKNGMLNWITGELKPHSPDYLSTIRIPINYNPSAACPKTDEFLRQILDENIIPLIYEVFGYILIPTTKFEKALLLVGSGANGKGTLISLINSAIGRDNISNITVQEIGGEDKFALSKLYGKLLNTYPDMDSNIIKYAGKIKAAISGDRISAQEKFRSMFEFSPFARFIFSCNKLPETTDRTYAFWRRWIVIPFERRFLHGVDADEGILNKLTTEQELSGFLNLGLQGLRRLDANRQFSETQKTFDALERYKVLADPIAAFVSEVCQIDADMKAVKQDLFNAYRKYCENFGVKPNKQVGFNEHLEKTFSVDEIRIGSRRWWKGIGIIDTTYLETEKVEKDCNTDGKEKLYKN